MRDKVARDLDFMVLAVESRPAEPGHPFAAPRNHF